uniref:Purple acid phosphatase Fn3-like domain-containing protein n=1 Tax=Aegilops tauschii subsp. strangulata TaxID=200361 RepID=A0A453RMM4_AEGTS
MGMAHVLLAAALAMVAAAATVSAWPAEGIQPLSKIAMNKATVNLHGSAYVRATPALLGDQDEDTVWVTVKYGWENPSADDWIAVFSPADFISGSCPNPSRYPGEPLLCTAPIKYQYANYSANYLHGGKGAIRFQLINQRSDFSFALLAGGLENVTISSIRTVLSEILNPFACEGRSVITFWFCSRRWWRCRSRWRSRTPRRRCSRAWRRARPTTR